MILQALCDYYDALSRRGDITPPGWSVAKVSFALDIDEQGTLHGIIPLKFMPESGKKEIPQSLQVPEQMKRSGSKAPSYFLCDNTQYFLGLEKGVVTAKALRCFRSCKETHLKILSGCDCKEARAICNFFLTWDPEEASSHPGLKSWYNKPEDGNFVFSVHGVYAHQVKEIQGAWKSQKGSSEVIGRCMVSGEIRPIARIHNSVKGIYADSLSQNGWTLVSVNKEAFESYGKTKGFNSPISEESAFSYTTALNHLLSDKPHVKPVGGSTVVYWAEDAEPLCQDVFSWAVFGGTSEIVTDADLQSVVSALATGDPVDVNGVPLRPDNRFYVLGLAPNASRLSVRFFFRNTFGELLNNIQKHYDRLEIVRPEYEKAPRSLWRLVFETQRTSKEVSDDRAKGSGKPDKELEKLAADLLYSILTDQPYPANWLSKVLARIHREQNINSAKAAILKAYVLKNSKNLRCKEVASMSLKAGSDYFPYVWGRIFSVFEDIQLQYTRIENPGARPNATIKSRFFNAASTTPEHVFPTLERLKNSHMDKLEKQRPALYLSFSRQLAELFSKVEFPFPNYLNNEEQVAFFLGYYHQTQKRYEKKEENENV